MDRPDLRQIAENIREALSEYDRDALLEMLTYVFKEYVVEGPPPVLISQVDGIADLAQMSFAQLIETLQQRLDHPELELFRVNGDQVLVRAGGALTPLDVSSRPALPTEPEMPIDGEPGHRATAAEAERRGRGDLAGGRRGVNQAPPPRPRGVSVSSRPTATPSPPAPASEPPPAAAENPGEQADKPEAPEGGDDASVRFSLLELD